MRTLGKIQRIDMKSSEFPTRLRDIPNPPRQIYVSGDASLLHGDAVSVVGSRKYTIYGKNIAKMIGKRLGECGIPVVSGLAYGIDAFSHEGALDGGGKMIGVLASGILRMGPRKNEDLMMRGLERGGVVVSEYPPDEEAKPYTYPARNRIISGLGNCLVVVEANYNSGALITAQHATDQGRPVYAVPGNINSQFSLGSNLLIRDGAYPLVIVDDIIRNLGIDPKKSRLRKLDIGDDERNIYENVKLNNGTTPDAVAAGLGKSVSWVNSMITVMEIKGILETYGGKIYLAN